eukprot:TRINITY_DN7189_c0_g1_i1.p1 TRINITY_DN7189_c0_g1~~TRINITY_DN7189_c0_g1_i1.p1  ORF type:complete len:522 (+),score=216.02 TRINITY_DN7189_c0_g1_i1:38-1567(+)
MALEVSSADLIRLILQFLKESGLQNSYQALQQESQVSLNTVDSIENFTTDILNGRWDSVLQVIPNLRVPQHKLTQLYEQIFLEILEVREIDTAKNILRNTEPMQILKQHAPDQYLRLEHLLAKSNFEPREAYGENTKEKRRAILAKAFASEVTIVPPSRLLNLLSQSLKWQQYQGILTPGTEFDLFRGISLTSNQDIEIYPKKLDKSIKFSDQSHTEFAIFSPDGQSLVTGSIDGFIEVWNFVTGKLKSELTYQNEDKFMMHEESVLCLTFSHDSQLLASGAQDGKIKVWQLQSGRCLKRFDGAHAQGVTCINFSRDSTQILSCSFDSTIRVHGLKSGKTIKIFRGHTSYVNTCIYINDDQRIVSGSSDGTIKIWDNRTTDCLFTFRPRSDGNDLSIFNIQQLPNNQEHYAIFTRSNTIRIMTLKGQLIKELISTTKHNVDYVAGCISPKGNWINCLTEDGELHSFSSQTGSLENTIKVHDKEPIGIVQHPHQNMIVTFCAGLLSIWKA